MTDPEHRPVPRREDERVVPVALGRHRVRVSIRKEGAPGLPLLLCNGIGAEYPLWDEFRTEVARPTISFDVRRGHLGNPPSIRSYAGFVRAVVRQLGLHELDVLGMSWGGIVAQQLARDHPSVVRRLVLASTTPGFMSLPARPTSAMALLSPSRHIERMDEVVTKIYGGDFLEDPALVRKLRLARPIHEATYRRQLVAILGWTSVPWLPTIQKETLILHADDDPVVPVVNSRLMSWLMPRAQRTVVHGGGHLFLFTRAEEYARVVTDFLSRDMTDLASGAPELRMAE